MLGGAGGRRKIILGLQWFLVLATGVLLWARDPNPGLGLGESLVLVSAGGAVFLTFLPASLLLHSTALSAIVLADTSVMTAVAVLTGYSTAETVLFFLLLFVTVGAGRSLRLWLPTVVISGVVYVLTLYQVQAFSAPIPAGGRVGLLMVGAALLAYWLQGGVRGRPGSGEDSVFTADLFEFGKILARAEDPEALYTRIPRLLGTIMNADACELAIIEDDRIVRRILPNRVGRDFCPMNVTRSIHEQAAASPEIQSYADLQEDIQLKQRDDAPLYPYRAYMSKSWAIRGKPAGLVALYREKRGQWSDHSRQKFQFLVDQSVLAIHNAQLRQELEMQARSDGLTGLANHRYFHERLEEEFARARRKNHALSVILVDLDYFKRLNDSEGHRVGDQILEQIGALLRSNIRRMDLAGRVGGDEFAIALPETSSNDTDTFCQRVLLGAAKLKVGQLSGFSLSIGSATYPFDGKTLPELLEHADHALYRSKHLGRGRATRYADLH